MMFFKNLSFLSLGILTCGFVFTAPATGHSQTVTVNSSIAADNVTNFHTIQEAVESFAYIPSSNTSGVHRNNPAPNVIHIPKNTTLTGSLSTSHLSLLDDIELTCPDGTATVLLEPVNHNGTLAGIAWGLNSRLTVKNLRLLPAQDNELDCFLYIPGIALVNSFNAVELDNVVMCAGTASNKPLLSQAQTIPNLEAAGVKKLKNESSAVIIFPYSLSNNTKFIMKNTAIGSYALTSGLNTNVASVYCYGNGNDTIHTATIEVLEGCVFSNTGQATKGIFARGAYVKVEGRDSNPVVFTNINSAAISLTAPSQATMCEVSHTHFYNNQGVAVQESFGGVGFLKSFKNCVVANDFGHIRPGATNMALSIAATGIMPPLWPFNGIVEISDSVFVNTALTNEIVVNNNVARNIEIDSCIFGGNNNVSAASVLNNSVSSAILMNDCVWGDSGEYDYVGQAKAGAGQVIVENDSRVNLTFENVTNPYAANFFKVSQAAVTDWNVY